MQKKLDSSLKSQYVLRFEKKHKSRRTTA